MSLALLLIKLNFPLCLVQAFDSIKASILAVLAHTPFSVLPDSFVKPFRLSPVLIRSFFFLSKCLLYNSTNLLCFKNYFFVFPLVLRVEILCLFTYLCLISLKSGSRFKQDFTYIYIHTYINIYIEIRDNSPPT